MVWSGTVAAIYNTNTCEAGGKGVLSSSCITRSWQGGKGGRPGGKKEEKGEEKMGGEAGGGRKYDPWEGGELKQLTGYEEPVV